MPISRGSIELHFIFLHKLETDFAIQTFNVTLNYANDQNDFPQTGFLFRRINFQLVEKTSSYSHIECLFHYSYI